MAGVTLEVLLEKLQNVITGQDEIKSEIKSIRGDLIEITERSVRNEERIKNVEKATDANASDVKQIKRMGTLADVAAGLIALGAALLAFFS